MFDSISAYNTIYHISVGEEQDEQPGRGAAGGAEAGQAQHAAAGQVSSGPITAPHLVT